MTVPFLLILDALLCLDARSIRVLDEFHLRDEIRALMGAGIPLADVIAQASWKAREWLGLPGLVEGALADFVVYDADPRKVQATLYSPRRIVLRGAVVG